MRSARAAVLLIAALAAAAAAAEGQEAIEVLATRSFWRCHVTWSTILVRRESGALEAVDVEWPARGAATVSPAKAVEGTALPPGDWASADFDDRGWARGRGPLFTRGTRRIALICARGKFRVTDPSAVGELSLSLAYRGGAVVRLNGHEVAQGHLPDGDIGPETPAEDYPREAYLRPDGTQLRHAFREPEKHPDRYALRTRHLEARIPARLLRQGTNVLAIELHRAPVAECFYTARFRDAAGYTLWDMVGLEAVRLAAPAGPAVVPNVERPPGLQVWNQPPFVSVHNVDYGDPTEPLRPVELPGVRNGVFSGQVVVGSSEPLRLVGAEAGPLAGPGGAVLDGPAVLVRAGALGGHAASHNESHRYRTPIPDARERRRFDALLPRVPRQVAADEHTGGAVLPIWVSVRVPADAPPGRYEGDLTIRPAEGVALTVPVTLRVIDWTLPPPAAYASHLGLIQSPQTLALHYGVPLWSEAHWRLVDRSFALLGELGTKVVYIPVLRRTYFGNEHGMVRWVRRGDGSCVPDFELAERYLDAALRRLGKVPVVCLYCWDVNTGSHYFGTRKFREPAGVPYSVLDPATGRLEEATGPKWADPAAADFWRPVLEGFRRLLAERGIEDSLMVGIAGDRQPSKDAVEALQAAAPGAPWVCSSHGVIEALFGQPVGYNSAVWGLRAAPDPREKRTCGWRNPRRLVAFPRAGSSVVGKGMRTGSPLGAYRIAMEAALTARGSGEGLRGIGRCGADFWPVLESARGRRTVLGRYPETSHWHGGWLRNSTPHVLAPGPHGPVATARYEMLREGIQEAQARVFLEDTLADPARRARLGEALAARCREVLDRRVRANRRAIEAGGRYLTWAWFAGSGVRRRTAELYEAAAQAAAALAP